MIPVLKLSSSVAENQGLDLVEGSTPSKTIKKHRTKKRSR
jgi:hypothetical protein